MDVLSVRVRLGQAGPGWGEAGRSGRTERGWMIKGGSTGWRGRVEGMAWAARRLGRRASHHPVSPV